MSTETEFKWTDELVVEFASWSCTKAPTFQGRYSDIEDFKKSKVKERIPLFITEDGVKIFEGDKVFTAKKDYEDLRVTSFIASSRNNKEWALQGGTLWFSTEDKAKEYILHKKPLFSLQEIIDKLNEMLTSSALAIREFKILAEQKINDKNK